MAAAVVEKKDRIFNLNSGTYRLNYSGNLAITEFILALHFCSNDLLGLDARD